MAIDTTKILLLGAIAAAGFIVYRRFAPAAAAVEMNQQLEDLTPEDVHETYAAAEKTWQERLQPTTMPNGNLLFEPLDLSETNPLSGYVAVLKKLNRSLNQLAGESGRAAVYLSSDRPNDPHQIGRLYFFNPQTGREVGAFELKKNADLWLPGMQEALQNTFVHAFNAACRLNPRYNQWDNTLNTGIKEAAMSYMREQCDVHYPVTM